ncbi:MAG TPA: hypothetical protein G4O00_07350, partial [Thermoflexia bacterium]|nr:hypothetical protein [Thermoflexia bacterium]
GMVGANDRSPLNGRLPLVGVLEDLADALEGYASGDPAALAAVQSASEANGRLRAAYAACADP